MEDGTFDSQAWELDLLGQDFLELLSQPVEHYTFSYPIEEHSYQADDWLEFQDLICMSPMEDTLDFDVPATTPDRARPESLNLLKDCGGGALSNPTFVSEGQSSMISSEALETRKFEDFLSEFAISQASDKTTKRRKRFSNDRRKEVSHIRKAGACVRCKLMKTACKLELPCASCMKAFQDIDLGRTLCIRQKLTDVRFTADLWDRREDILWFEQEVPALFGARKPLKISLTALCEACSIIRPLSKHEGPCTASNPLEIVIQDFKPKSGAEEEHIFNAYSSKDGVKSTTAPQFYAIPGDSLPSLDILEAWALETVQDHPLAFIGGIRGSFLTLARRYSDCKRPLPQQGLMREVVRIACLHGIWSSDLPRPRDPNQQCQQYASNAVFRQISAIVAQGIVDAEVEVLSLLQKQVFGKKGPGRQNMLPIWTSLFLLILIYRRTLFSYGRSGRGGTLRQLAQHMYDMLVSIYSGLFRPSSPLWLNWLRDDVYDLFGRDWRITEAMGTLKTEVGHHANGETSGDMEFESHDVLLRSLIFNHEKQLGKKFMEKPFS